MWHKTNTNLIIQLIRQNRPRPITFSRLRANDVSTGQYRQAQGWNHSAGSTPVPFNSRVTIIPFKRSTSFLSSHLCPLGGKKRPIWRLRASLTIPRNWSYTPPYYEYFVCIAFPGRKKNRTRHIVLVGWNSGRIAYPQKQFGSPPLFTRSTVPSRFTLANLIVYDMFNSLPVSRKGAVLHTHSPSLNLMINRFGLKRFM